MFWSLLNLQDTNCLLFETPNSNSHFFIIHICFISAITIPTDARFHLSRTLSVEWHRLSSNILIFSILTVMPLMALVKERNNWKSFRAVVIINPKVYAIISTIQLIYKLKFCSLPWPLSALLSNRILRSFLYFHRWNYSRDKSATGMNICSQGTAFSMNFVRLCR